MHLKTTESGRFVENRMHLLCDLSWAYVARRFEHLLLLSFFLVALGLAGTAGAQTAGRTAGSFAVDAFGHANYSIPIWAPRGPNGLQPSIALTYNSSQGNGDVGVGWTLSGISAITRCNRTVAQDGYDMPVTMSILDAYCLDGQRLQVTGGSGSVQTNQTELANFGNATEYGWPGNAWPGTPGAMYFVVQAPNGVQYEYGNTSTSYSVQTYSGQAFAWMLDKVTDTAGNTMVFTYVNAPDTTAVPDTISWTPTAHGSSQYTYTMKFNYTANNSQTSTYNYINGHAYSNTELLSSIAISAPNNGGLLKQYNLNYTQPSATGRNLLTTVTECADSAGNNCLRPTTAGYQNAAFGLSATPTTAVSSSVQNVMTNYDFDGDGIPDLLIYTGSGWYVEFGTATGYGAPLNTGLTTPALIAGSNPLGSHLDGVYAKNGSTWWFYSWNGSTFPGVNTGIPVDSSSSNAVLDVNGDGLPDFVSFYPGTVGSAAYITTRQNTSTGSTLSFSTNAPVAFSDTNGPSTSSATNSGGMLAPSNYFPNSSRSWDFNGDGRQDLFYYAASLSCAAASQGICTQWQTAQSTYTLLGQSNGSFLTVPFTTGGIPTGVQMVNWNNDKCTDIAYGSAVYVSACDGTVGATIPLAGPLYAAMDLDGDGRSDAIIESGTMFAVQISTGVGVNTPVSLGISAITSGTLGRIDVGGTGLDELACLGCTTNAITFYARSSPGTVPDLLTSISDGNGNYVNPSYVSITQTSNSHYTNGTDATAGSGYVNFDDAMYVVGLVTYSDPSTSGGTYQQTYTYADAWQNTQGRGFQGFGSLQMCDSRNGVWDTRTYSHDSRGFPYVGMLATDTKNQSTGCSSTPGATISSLSRTPTAETLNSTLGSQRYFPYSSTDTRGTYEVGGPENGMLITTKTTTYGAPDSYGNFPSVTTVTQDNDPHSPTPGQTWTTEIATQYQTADLTNWCVNLPYMNTTAYSASALSGANVVQTTQFTKDPVASTCRNNLITHLAQTAGYNVTETLAFDLFGNISSDTTAGTGIARTTSTNWGTTGQFPTIVTDPSGAVTQYAHNASGNVAQVTDPNNLNTYLYYTDGFWRLTMLTRPDGTYTLYGYQDCVAFGACLIASHAVYTTHTDYGSNGAQLSQGVNFADSVDRPLVTSASLLNGTSRNEVRYDSFGRTVQQSAPCIWVSLTTSCTSWTTKTYDLRNRVLHIQRPGITLPTIYIYAGRTTTITDPNNHTKTFVSDVNKWLRQTTDAMSTPYTVSLTYDAAGDKTKVTDSTGATLWQGSYVYGVHPFLSGETDLYRGIWTYTSLDALGERLTWTDPNGKAFSATYDALSRPLTRSEPDLYTQWVWGTGQVNGLPAYNVGHLQSVCTGAGSNPMSCTAAGYSESETYDSLGRPAARAVTIPGDTTYTYGLAYNSTTGRPDTLTYPTTPAGPALKIQYGYAYGTVETVTDLTDSLPSPLWTANSQNAARQITEETLGNNVVVSHAFDALTGWPNNITAGLNGGTALQNESFLFDPVGNLTQRSDNNRGFVENIYPDADDRIDHTTINGNADMQMTYNSNGSIHTRQFLAAPPSTDDYQSPNSLVAENSNALSGGTVTWTSFNQPSVIPGPTNTSSTFLYDHNHQRWQQQASYGGSAETTTYIRGLRGALLEKVVTPSGTIYRHYVSVGNTTVMYLPSGTSPTIDYFTGDHLASTAAITDQNGNLILMESFSPWGARRDPTNWTLHQSPADTALLANTMRHGFTGHEHIDNLAMIDMNGRMYQGTGFMSPDPNTPDPTNTQDYNPYGYVRNNPLTLTDPSGFADSCSQTGTVACPPMPAPANPSCQIGTDYLLQQNCATNSANNFNWNNWEIANPFGGNNGNSAGNSTNPSPVPDNCVVPYACTPNQLPASPRFPQFDLNAPPTDGIDNMNWIWVAPFAPAAGGALLESAAPLLDFATTNLQSFGTYLGNGVTSMGSSLQQTGLAAVSALFMQAEPTAINAINQLSQRTTQITEAVEAIETWPGDIEALYNDAAVESQAIWNEAAEYWDSFVK
jgi:RHS repeat-associated protein